MIGDEVCSNVSGTLSPARSNVIDPTRETPWKSWAPSAGTRSAFSPVAAWAPQPTVSPYVLDGLPVTSAALLADLLAPGTRNYVVAGPPLRRAGTRNRVAGVSG